MKQDTQHIVMIIDDNHLLREIFSTSLEMDGHQVLQAGNGEEALTLLNSLKKTSYPDCIILDLIMPTMDGNTFLKVMEEKSHEEFKKIPIIICSATGVYDKTPQIRDELTKPVDLVLLSQTVKKNLDRLLTSHEIIS